MQPPENVSPEDQTETDTVVTLDEEGNVQEENAEYSGIASFIQTQFRRAKDHRQADEDRWLMAYRNYRGIYGPEVQFTDTEKSKAFVKITKTKVQPAMRRSWTSFTPLRSFPSVFSPLITQKMWLRRSTMTRMP